jgi:hypothetical protein
MRTFKGLRLLRADRLGPLLLRRNRIHYRLERGRRGDHVDVRHPRHDGDRNVYVKALKERSELICDDLLVRLPTRTAAGRRMLFK